MDLKKAYDSVQRRLFWRFLKTIGVPTRILAIIKDFHQHRNATVNEDSTSTEAFQMNNGLRQGCELAPTLSTT